jgi:adenylate cyclase
MLSYAEELIVLSEQNGFAEWLPWGVFYRGCALADLGELKNGVAAMERGVECLESIGSVWPIVPAMLASGYARIGQTVRALTMLGQILTEVDRFGSVVHKAEILRIKGEVHLMGDYAALDEAEASFRAAIDLARSQEARWWELRASVSLTRLLRDTNRRDEARARLAEIYNWFTEGFDTADMKDAKALLDELSA